MTSEIAPYEEVIIEHLKELYKGKPYHIVHNDIVPFICKIREEVLLKDANKAEKYKYARWDDLENTIVLHKSALQTVEQLDAIQKAMELEDDKKFKDYAQGISIVVKALKRRLNETL